MRFESLFILGFIVPFAAHGQADFTRQFMSSGLYETRKSPASAPKKRAPANDGETKVEMKSEAQANASTKVEIVAPPPAEEKKPPTAPVVEIAEPAITEQVKSLLGSADEDLIVKYEEKIHPDDQRLNRLEVEGRVGVSSSDASSNYSFRRYNTSFGAVDLRSSVWVAPSVGLTGGLKFSLGASVRGDAATGSMDRLHDEEIAAGLRFRRFFGLSRLSPSVEFDVLYLTHTFNVSTDSVSHPRWVSSGVGVGLQTRFPVSANRAWTFGGRIFPRLKHSESKSSIDVSSGDEGENVRLDLDVGGDLSFGRGSQVVYGLQIGAERNLFDGPASLPDPQTGATPSNVTVTNTLLNFSFGYRWGR